MIRNKSHFVSCLFFQVVGFQKTINALGPPKKKRWWKKQMMKSKKQHLELNEWSAMYVWSMLLGCVLILMWAQIHCAYVLQHAKKETHAHLLSSHRADFRECELNLPVILLTHTLYVISWVYDAVIHTSSRHTSAYGSALLIIEMKTNKSQHRGNVRSEHCISNETKLEEKKNNNCGTSVIL